MYRDTEQSYRGWTLDVYQAEKGNLASIPEGMWCCDAYLPEQESFDFRLMARKRKEVVNGAREYIDAVHRNQEETAMQESEKELRWVAENLFMLCRRAEVQINHGNPDRAKEILSHAPRIAGKVGIKESIIRTME